MERLLNDGELAATFRERGLRRAAEMSWRRVARETAQQYRKVLGDL